MCGEKVLLRLKHSRKLGSPPRVRGKVHKVSRFDAIKGITPACAGKRWTREDIPLGGADHPRVCGEKTKKIP